MYLLMCRVSGMLAQIPPWEDPAPPAAPPKRPMSLSDFKDGLRAYSTGETRDNSMMNALLATVALIAVVTLVVHLRQRRKSGGPKDSLRALAWELGRKVHFPFGSRVLLIWVARSSSVPFASLLLSVALFEKSVAAWAAQPTFGLLRRWGRSRLDRLKPVLFG